MKKYFDAFVSLIIRSVIGLFIFYSCDVTAKDCNSNNVFVVDSPDYELSPYTGMTRDHWIEAATYLLEGAFEYVDDLNDPMWFPVQPGKSYPQDLTDRDRVITAKLEGLCRTLFLASPLLRENEDLSIGGINVASYYRHQILQLINPESASYIPLRTGGTNQRLVEFGALSISLFTAPNVLWDPLTDNEKDLLAKTMISYADGPTLSSNWRFFNIFILSFFDSQGYDVNEELLVELLKESLEHYKGDGWYIDNPAYDFYSSWAFQFYGMLWSELYGNSNYPQIASKLRNNFLDLEDSNPYLFSRDGEMLMWGRSIPYRFASISHFPFMGFFDDDNINYGWMRHISSSTILQFLKHPKMLQDHVPTLGFYGAFEPAVQYYNCRASVYWMGKAFIGLIVPEDNPFWTSVENRGAWDDVFKQDNVYHNFQAGSEILITNYPNIGASEIRAWCYAGVEDDWQQIYSTENYNRLSYNTAFPWQADGDNGEVAMNYLIYNDRDQWEAFRLYSFEKFKDEVYYRDVVLETNDDVKFNLAETGLANGILRVDCNLSSTSTKMRLGHYALPEKKQEIVMRIKEVDGNKVTIIDNGEYQLAMVPLLGWKNTKVLECDSLHPEGGKSSVIVAEANYMPDHSSSSIYAILKLWKKSGEEWTKEELMPVKDISVDLKNCSVFVELRCGGQKNIIYN
ncbi:DUF2264 domain-containing protein [Marinilabiliaceae bacterium ANBcel2]|nr:DUF2264 domain-containing protein [Marinilabiliaceae bacterium ANBcel2]